MMIAGVIVSYLRKDKSTLHCCFSSSFLEHLWLLHHCLTIGIVPNLLSPVNVSLTLWWLVQVVGSIEDTSGNGLATDLSYSNTC